MKKRKREIWKRIAAGLLSAAMFLTMLPVTELETKAAVTLKNPVIEEDSNMEAGQKVTWDCIWFGSYPQTEIVAEATQCGTYGNKYWGSKADYIVDASLYAKLQSASYDSNGDTTISGTKFRRLKKGDATCSYNAEIEWELGIENRYYSWKDITTYHYFRYEPIKWRVLSTDGSTAFLLADQVLDDQAYNTEYLDVSWETSTIRSWLNGYGTSSNVDGMDYSTKNFIDSSFSVPEQKIINTKNNDKVFLMSVEEVCNTDVAKSYGFIESSSAYDEARMAKGSTYAKAMGIGSDDVMKKFFGNCCWWTCSTKINYCASYIGRRGSIWQDGYEVNWNNVGVRPALHLNLSSDLWSYAGTVCSDGVEDFSTENNGWSVPNCIYGFGYENKLGVDQKYRIPLSRYDKYFSIEHPGDALEASILAPLDRIGAWEGSCFGMSLLAAADYLNDVDISSYTKKGGKGLIQYGYSGIRAYGAESTNPKPEEGSKPGQTYYTVADNEELIALVERMQVSQMSDQFHNVEIFKDDPTYSGLMKYLNDNDGTPILVNLDGNSGHTVLIDPSKPVYDCSSNKGKGWYGVCLYDPNVPQNGNSLDNPAEYYNCYSFLYLNTLTGQWEYDRLNKDELIKDTISNSYSFLGHEKIKFYDVSKLGKEYYTGKLTLNLIRSFVFHGDSIDVTTEQGTPIIAFHDNNLTALDKKYDYDVYYENSDTNQVKYYMSLPEDKVFYTAQNAETVFCNNGYTFSLSLDGKSNVALDSLGGNLSIKAEKPTQFATTIYEKANKDSFNVESTLKEDESVTIEKKEDKLVFNSSSEINVHINHTDEDGEAQEYNIKVNGEKVIDLNKPSNDYIIVLKGISHNIAAGKKIKLTASVSPKNTANKTVTWKSSNTKVATVTQSGVVTLKKNTGGKSVTITATATDGSGVQAVYKIKSMKGVVKKVSISGNKSVKAGKSLKLKAKVTATKGANKKLKWTSSNPKYAQVTSSGKVKTYKAGKGKKVKITAMATDGSNKKKTVTIRIK